MANKLEKAARRAIEIIDNFDADCERDQYTDTDDAWQIFRQVQDELKRALKKPRKGGR